MTEIQRLRVEIKQLQGLIKKAEKALLPFLMEMASQLNKWHTGMAKARDALDAVEENVMPPAQKLSGLLSELKSADTKLEKLVETEQKVASKAKYKNDETG